MESRKVADLAPADYNPRRLSEKQKADLMESVTRFGQVEPLIVNADGKIIGGHSRLKVYTDLGIEETPVMVPSRKLTAEEEKELNIRLNKNTGEWDWGALKEFFDAEALGEWGFGEEELMVNFGLGDADAMDLDPDRFMVLVVRPPESPVLRERAIVRFEKLADYEKVKAAIKDKKITAEKLLDLIS